MIFNYKYDNNLQLQKKNINNEINKQLNIQETTLKILLECLKNIDECIQKNEDLEIINKMIQLLKELKTNLEKLRDNISNLKKLKNILEVLSFDFSNDSIDQKIEEYNKLAIECKNNIKENIPEISNFILKYIKETSFSYNIEKTKELIINENAINNNVIKNENQTENNTIINKDKEERIIDNDTLTISEIKNKVFLPYSVSDLNEKLKENENYRNLQEIIDNEYTIPLDKYKNSIIARFKETYNLMRKKENASITDSLDLALELSFNNLLNPAIITACKNLDELDIYLDCLSSNELDKFNIFKIKYEIYPR